MTPIKFPRAPTLIAVAMTVLCLLPRDVVRAAEWHQPQGRCLPQGRIASAARCVRRGAVVVVHGIARLGVPVRPGEGLAATFRQTS